MPDRERIAQALLGAYGPYQTTMWEPGLEEAPLMKGLGAINQVGAGYGAGQLGGRIAQALVGQGLPALQGLGEAGALFPEGMAYPKNPQIIREMKETLTPSQQMYRSNEAIARWHAENYDWPAVLADKWAMLRHSGGS